MGRLFFVLALALGLVALPCPARAELLTPEESARLARGEVVRRTLEIERDGERYVGGVSYAIVDAPPSAVMAALGDVDAYRSILPLTLEARRIKKQGRDSLVYFKHGGRLGTAAYVAVVRRESPSLVRFWLDRSHPHDIDDVWGYFRVTPIGNKSLVTYGAVVNLGFGVIRMLFEERIRARALGTPELVQRYVEARWRDATRKQAQASLPR